MEKGLLGTVDDAAMQPELQKVVDLIEAQVKNRDPFDRIVKAGKTVIYDPKISEQLLKGIEDSEDLPATIGTGIAGLVLKLRKDSRGSMPPDEMAQAATVILMEALDSLTKAGLVELSPDLISEATMAMMEPLLVALGVTKEKLATLMRNSQKVMGDPEMMAAYEGSKAQPAQPAQPAQGDPNV